jgi:hypothetical protein
MNELFGPEPSIQQLRFHGDRAAFVRGNLSEFVAMLHTDNLRTGTVGWLNDNIMACSRAMWNYVTDTPDRVTAEFWCTFVEEYQFTFGTEELLLMCVDNSSSIGCTDLRYDFGEFGSATGQRSRNYKA